MSDRTTPPGDVSGMLRAARQNRGLTQAEVARRMGLPAQSVERLERAGYSGHTVASLLRYAQALNGSLEMELVLPGAMTDER